MTPTHDLIPIRRALLSVSDKAGLVGFARGLAGRGVELISTGGTARALADAGLAVTPVEAVTGFAEMMGGRVKTLHPKIHGGILALRDEPGHAGAMREHGIGAIDLVCVNLYPFAQTAARPGASDAEAVEQIDIGGPSMVRSAAKNHQFVAVVTEPGQYGRVLDELDAKDGATGFVLRRELAGIAFARTAAYDAAIAEFFQGKKREEVDTGGTPAPRGGGGADSALSRGLQPARLHEEGDQSLPGTLCISLGRAQPLRYGENPHQPAAVYAATDVHEPGIAQGTQLGGKALSYNNIADASAALELVRAMARFDPRRPGACVVKHANPCGAAAADSPSEAIRLAIAGDPMAAYGGILACSAAIDEACAEVIARGGSFFEVVVAPAISPGATQRINGKWKNCRLIAVGQENAASEAGLPGMQFRSIPGGVLAQQRDLVVPDPGSWVHAAGPSPSNEQLHAAGLLACVVRALSSNAVCLGGPDGEGIRLFGAGAGQMDRVASCRLAIDKAAKRARGAIAQSDAFFPFADGPGLLIDAGVSMIVHPGGSKRDGETFELCEQHGVTCMTTGVRHFRH